MFLNKYLVYLQTFLLPVLPQFRSPRHQSRSQSPRYPFLAEPAAGTLSVPLEKGNGDSGNQIAEPSSSIKRRTNSWKSTKICACVGKEYSLETTHHYHYSIGPPPPGFCALALQNLASSTWEQSIENEQIVKTLPFQACFSL